MTNLEVSQVHSVLRVMQLAQEQVPQTPRLGLFLQLFHDGGNDLPSLNRVVGDLVVVQVFGGKTFSLEEIDEVGELVFGERREPGFDLEVRREGR